MDKHYGHFARFVAILSLGFCAAALAAGGATQGTSQSKRPARQANTKSQMKTNHRTSGANHATQHMQSGARSHMSHDASHTRIRKAQEALDHAGAKLKVDGMMGPHTRSALRHFQRTHGMKATGGLGPKTRRMLGID